MNKTAFNLAVVSLGLAAASASAAVQPISATAQTGLASAGNRDEQTITTFGDTVSTTELPFKIDGSNPNPDNQKTATATSHIHFAADQIAMNLSLSFDAGQNAPDLMSQGEFAFDLSAATSVTFHSTGFSMQSLGLSGASRNLPSMLNASGHVTLPAGAYDYFAFLDSPSLSGTSPIATSAAVTITFSSGVGAAPPVPEPTILIFLAASAAALCTERRKR
jgi:hypothetical protein